MMTYGEKFSFLHPRQASEDAESLASALHSNSKSNVICSIGPGNGIVELL